MKLCHVTTSGSWVKKRERREGGEGERERGEGERRRGGGRRRKKRRRRRRRIRRKRRNDTSMTRTKLSLASTHMITETFTCTHTFIMNMHVEYTCTQTILFSVALKKRTVPQTSLYFCFFFMIILKTLCCFPICFCSPSNLDQTENSAPRSGTPARGSLYSSMKFDLATQNIEHIVLSTLLKTADSYFSHSSQ